MEKILMGSVIGSFVISKLGGWDSLLLLLVIVMVIDYITGLLAAGVEGKISTKVGFKGIARKFFIFVLVALAYIIDNVLGTSSFIKNVTILFYLSNEMISIVENAGKVGLPIPSLLTKAIQSLREKNEKKEEEKE